MKLTGKDKVWLVCWIAWMLLFFGPGLMLVNRDVFVFNIPILWFYAGVGWCVGVVLIYFQGYVIPITNVDVEEDEELLGETRERVSA
jgi:hypothetical protein